MPQIDFSKKLKRSVTSHNQRFFGYRFTFPREICTKSKSSLSNNIKSFFFPFFFVRKNYPSKNKKIKNRKVGKEWNFFCISQNPRSHKRTIIFVLLGSYMLKLIRRLTLFVNIGQRGKIKKT